jgi:tRNA (Thr-GGU) A37 N-methylase
MLVQTPPHRGEEIGVFSICSPRRPNPIGLSVVAVLSVDGPVIHVRGIDMLNGTPILDIKPHVLEASD